MHGPPHVTLTTNFLRTRRIGLSSDRAVAAVVDSVVDSLGDLSR